MPNEVIEVESELSSVAQEQRRLEEQIMEFRQRIHTEETWLKRNIPATMGYQQMVEEVLALEAYVEELQAQLACLDEVLLELSWERKQWLNPPPLPGFVSTGSALNHQHHWRDGKGAIPSSSRSSAPARCLQIPRQSAS